MQTWPASARVYVRTLSASINLFTLWCATNLNFHSWCKNLFGRIFPSRLRWPDQHSRVGLWLHKIFHAIWFVLICLFLSERAGILMNSGIFFLLPVVFDFVFYFVFCVLCFGCARVPLKMCIWEMAHLLGVSSYEHFVTPPGLIWFMSDRSKFEIFSSEFC